MPNKTLLAVETISTYSLPCWRQKQAYGGCIYGAPAIQDMLFF